MGASSRGFSPRSISAIFIGQGSVRLDARGKDTQKNATHCGKTKAEGPKTLRRFPCLPLPAASYSIRSVNSRVWGGVQTWSSQLCQPTVQVAVPVPLPLTGSVSVTSFS